MAENSRSNPAPDKRPLDHPSIYSDTAICDFSLLRCSRRDCGAENCNGNLYHCPLCPTSKCGKEIPSRVKEHFRKVHWDNRIHEFHGNYTCKLDVLN